MAALSCDYGVRPRTMILGDVEFHRALGSHFIALGYLICPSFELLVDAPGLVMLFDTEDAAKNSFEHFRAWIKHSQSGDAVAISFVEFKDRSYGMCIYQDHNNLIERTVPKAMLSEITPFFTNVSYMKQFDAQSSGYNWFKSMVFESPFVVVPATESQGPLWNLAFVKRTTVFHHENELPDHSPEAVALRASKASVPFRHNAIPESLRPKPAEIQSRRLRQLRRFFPVTLQRLRWNNHLSALRRSLLDQSYRNWQISQAICNSTLPYRFPDLFAQSNSHVSVLDLLYQLVNSFEALDVPQATLETISLDSVRDQIHQDVQYLLDFLEVPPKEGTDIQSQLLGLGFLDQEL